MPTLSLVLNLVVLVPVCAGLLARAGWTASAFGDWTPARGILLSVYIAIAITSAALLVHPDERMTAALLGVQVIYKLTTPFTVGTLRNPVVLSNLGIAAVHGATLALIYG